MQDAALARAVAGSGDRDAEAELCRRFAPRVRLYGLRHLRDLPISKGGGGRSGIPCGSARGRLLRSCREHLPVDARPTIRREHAYDLFEQKTGGAPHCYLLDLKST